MKQRKLILTLFISFSVLADKKFVFDICSYNNAQWYQRNLDSVMSQDYDPEKFRAIYTDDNSSDGTGALVKKYIEENGYQDRIILIQNKTRRRALANHYNAIHHCKDNEIILTLDGDDWCSDDQILNKLNELYSDSNIWFAYSRFVNWPKYETKKTFAFEYSRAYPKKIIDQNAYRYFTWVCGQLRSFYAWLAKSIKLEDLILSEPLSMKHVSSPLFLGPVEKFSPAKLDKGIKITNAYQGTFFPSACDVALMIPMLEMCGGRFKYFDEPIYIRNIATELNDHKVDPTMQNYCAFYVRTLSPYRTLHAPIKHYRLANEQKTIAVILPEEKGNILQRVKSVKNNVPNIQNIYIFGGFQDSSDARVDIDDVINIECASDIKLILCDILNDANAYVLFVGSEEIDTEINLGECIEQLEQTYATAFYPNLETPKKLNFDQLFNSDTYFWQFKYFTPKSTTVLHRARHVLEQLEHYKALTTSDFTQFITSLIRNKKSIGLFKKAK